MNKYQMPGSWGEVRDKIKAKWPMISDEEIEALRGNIDEIASKLQEQHGYAKDQAKRELKEFKTSL